tara:strand:+ start:45592 stop:46347 length:756 start_codon:yes stop_codon:yes gene_type:complete
MDKLRGLLKELGGSEDLIEAIAEEFAAYADTIREQYKVKLDKHVRKARAICLEEVNKEKAKMARKLSIYLESKTDHFERAAEKQRLNEESESVNLLKRTKALLEGVQIEDGQSQDLQVARRQVARLQQAVGSLREERNLAVTKANKANQIAKDVLKKNRLLEGKVKKSNVVSESKKGGPSAPKNKKPSTRTVLAESSKKPRRSRPRLDENRRVPNQPSSTRRVLDESQRRGKSNAKPGSKHISNIAASMED